MVILNFTDRYDWLIQNCPETGNGKASSLKIRSLTTDPLKICEIQAHVLTCKFCFNEFCLIYYFYSFYMQELDALYFLTLSNDIEKRLYSFCRSACRCSAPCKYSLNFLKLIYVIRICFSFFRLRMMYVRQMIHVQGHTKYF